MNQSGGGIVNYDVLNVGFITPGNFIRW